MTNFLPYAIIAGIVIVFFVVCYILFSGKSADNARKKESKQAAAREQQFKPLNQHQKVLAQHNGTAHQQHRIKDDTAPLPRVSTVTVRERQEHPEETAFVTTKGEAIRRNGHIVYEESSRQGRKAPKEDLDITRVLSREEILGAMEKVDKEEAAAYKARAEEAKKERQQQSEEVQRADDERLALDQDLRAQNRKARSQYKMDQDRMQEKERWAREVAETEGQEPSLADMAAVVSADLAARKRGEGTATQPPKKKHLIDAVMAENARAAKKTQTAQDRQQQDSPKAPEETMRVQPVKPAVSAHKKRSASSQPETVSDETQILDPVRTHCTAPSTAASAASAAGVVAASAVASAAAATLEQTRRMDPVQVAKAAAKPAEQAAQADPAVPPVTEQEKPHRSPWGNDLSGTTTKAAAVAGAAHHASIWDDEQPADSPIIKQSVSHFLSQYGIVTADMQQQAEYITAAAFQQIGCVNDAERQKALAPLIVQESLQNVQKAFAAHPEKYVATIALQAFSDIIHCPSISTRHLVAIDALKVMPYLTSYHYKILSILLLFLYSRNAHNVDTETFCQYIDKYVLPFLDGFPTERPYYQQLDYLHCTAVEGKETHFAEILSDSYPLLFRYRGFTEEELRKALKGKRIPSEFIVQSFNSPLYKLAMVDESMATRFFRLTGITDRAVQDHLLRLAKKRPAPFSGEEALDIMEDISPILADLGDIWDSSMLRVSTLSLLGLYLAQGYTKECIGEEFDVSRWFE
jgi:hypothetical protein